jgi:hypothetical protein
MLLMYILVENKFKLYGCWLDMTFLTLRIQKQPEQPVKT